MEYLYTTLCEKREGLISAFNKSEVALHSTGGTERMFPFPDTRGDALSEWSQASDTLSHLLKNPTGGGDPPPGIVRGAAITTAAPHLLAAAKMSVVGCRGIEVEPPKEMVDLIALCAEVIELGDALYLSTTNGGDTGPSTTETLTII